MTSFSPIPSYILGTIFTVSGIVSFLSPITEYKTFGFPLPPFSKAASSTTSTALVSTPPAHQLSPYVYAKGIRDLTHGLTFFIFQFQGQEAAIKPSLASFAWRDLWLVFWFGGLVEAGEVRPWNIGALLLCLVVGYLEGFETRAKRAMRSTEYRSGLLNLGKESEAW
ncbi:hypothetical protein IFR04_012507 [Cadophora malorum]|uniref:Uncharacterized protein n=1 Tax=Cadophora malorum TaxID=108018 RepID=A0A8H7W257_9HELO|nr:hypothetical protein IFR04_012507 [Cadophora malorum]